MKLSIVVPAYNEEGRIGPMLEAYLPFFAQRYGNQVEFIVVVNGSRDRTAEIVRAMVGNHAMLKCLVEPRSVGKGGALILGFKEARGELIGFVDADGATPPAAFQDLVDHMGDADAIIASRWAPGAKISPRQPLDRR
ncbi:MAG: glycosyltransferase, partial [Verrucomicrobia bacterium]|nr:glycosyltransferase [Verrucomicrobiota bacterium]